MEAMKSVAICDIMGHKMEKVVTKEEVPSGFDPSSIGGKIDVYELRSLLLYKKEVFHGFFCTRCGWSRKEQEKEK